ncbi:MAG: DUF4097 family beta strand repeat-containing protein [Candidatus Merdivicinus sp.]
MNRQEFLEQFIAALEPLTNAEREQISAYYEELIDDAVEQGCTEEECLARFGTPQQAAERFRAEYVEEGSAPTSGMAIPTAMTSTTSPESEFHTLDLQAEDIPIRIQPAESGQFQIHFEANPQRDLIRSELRDGTWYYHHRLQKRNLRNFFGFWGKELPELTVLVPTSFRGELRIRTSNAAIVLNGIRETAVVILTTSNDRIQAADASSGEWKIHTSNAHIQLDNIGALRLEAVTSNSKLTAASIHADTQQFKSSNGNIQLDDLVGKELTATTSNARITAKNCQFSEKIALTTSNGSISTERLSSHNLCFRSSNASIKGTLCGSLADYATECRTSNGSCNIPCLPANGQSKFLSATTSNGSIRLDFLAE